MERVLSALEPLCLDQLDEDWVLGIHHSEFLEIPEFPSDYEAATEANEITTVFLKLLKAIRKWLADEALEEEDKTWAVLSPHVKHENLLSVLAYYIDFGTKNVHTKEYRNNALLASRVYYKLMSISGFKAYHIYHAQLFTHSLGCLSYPKALCESDENYMNMRELSKEVNLLISELAPYVRELAEVVQKLQLQPTDMNFEEIMSNLVDITGGAIVNKLNIDKLELAKISQVIYQIIDVLLQDASGEPNPVSIRLLFKVLLPKLVSASVDNKNANSLVRASYVTYIGLLLTRFGKAAVSGFSVLIQHLCYTAEGLERAEVRQARVSLVVGLMSLLPRKSYRNTIDWILTLSTTAKLGHRHIALEILAQMLHNEPEVEAPPPPPPPPAADLPPTEQTVDKAETANPDGQQEVKSEADKPEEASDKSAVTNDDESTQDSAQPDVEEEAAVVFVCRAPTAPLRAVLRGVYARVADTSSTLRARALHVLADCIAAPTPALHDALLELDEGGSGRLAAAAARCASDERAAVRRAAVALLHHTVARTQDHGRGVLVNLCRDASVIVRSAAIAALGELAIQKGDQDTLDAFLSGPMHQLSDPETKVQEQVTTLLQTMLLDRLKPYSALSQEDPLPWAVVAAVVRRDLRRHLQKACALIAKSTTRISVRLVDIVSTHLYSEDKERQLHCLTLLAAVARQVDYSDTSFIVEYFYKLDADEECDSRLLALTLQLLSEWSQWIVDDVRTNLRARLVARLATHDACRIEVASLAAALDNTNLTWANELLQLFESRALSAAAAARAAAAAGVGVAAGPGVGAGAGAGVEASARTVAEAGAGAVAEAGAGAVAEAGAGAGAGAAPVAGAGAGAGALPALLLAAADVALVAPAPPRAALLLTALAALNIPEEMCGGGEGEVGRARGTVVAAVGRLCLRSREAAAAAAPALAAALATPRLPLPARVNALLALADICARYTCIVEPLLADICSCLRRSAPAQLRAACSAALTRLLLAAYLRLNTPLYYRYCALLADPVAAVREPAEYYVTWCLTPDHIYQHYVDTILHYNMHHYETLTFDERQLIYDVMLQRMTMVQRLNVQCRLAREVLGRLAEAYENGDPRSDALAAATLDAITLLAGPRMKLPRRPAAADAADIDELQERVTTNIVSHKMKRTVAEVVVPTVLRLYSCVRAEGGQLATYLVKLATDLLKDYKHEIEELIENDEELVQRVRQFQETIGSEPSFGNARNLVLTAPVEPETPRPSRKRRPPPARASNAKRPLGI